MGAAGMVRGMNTTHPGSKEDGVLKKTIFTSLLAQPQVSTYLINYDNHGSSGLIWTPSTSNNK